jgi:hypothetical protein
MSTNNSAADFFLKTMSSTTSQTNLEAINADPESNSYDFESHPDNPIFIFMLFFYSLSTLTAIASNFIVILVYLLSKSGKTDLSRFLFNLAIADFLMSTVCMPFTFAQVLLKRWIFGEIICPIGKTFFALFSL